MIRWTTLLLLAVAARAGDVAVHWGVECRDDVDYYVRFETTSVEDLTTRSWSYSEEYVETVVAAEAGRPVRVQRTYRKHWCRRSQLGRDDKRTKKERAKRNPEIEGVQIVADVKGDRLVPQGKVDRNVKRLLAQPGTFCRWEVLLPSEPGKRRELTKDDIKRLIPIDLLGKPTHVDGRCTAGTVVDGRIKVKILLIAKWRPDPKTRAECAGQGELIYDVGKRCVTELRFSGAAFTKSGKERRQAGSINIDLALKRRLPKSK